MDTIAGLRKNGPAIIGTGVVFVVLAGLTTAMRIMSKWATHAPFGFDDWTLFLAFVLFLISEILVIRSDIIGRLGTSVTDAALSTYGLYVYIYSIFYFSIMALCIVSILLLYRRIFPKPFMKTVTLVLITVVILWWIPPTIIQIGKPNEEETFPGDPDKKDANWNVTYVNYWLAEGIIEQCLIIVAIFLPIREVYKLQLNLHKRLLLTFIFCISYLCVITGIVRLATLYRPKQPDIDLSLGDVWINVHCGTAIMSVNLPVCWPLVSHREEIIDRLVRRGRASQKQGQLGSKGSGSQGSSSGASRSTKALDRLTAGADGSGTGLPGTRERSSSESRDDRMRAAARLDPRDVGTMTEARRIDSDDSQESAFMHSAELETGKAIGIRRSVRVETR